MTTTLLMLLCATCPTCSLKPTIDYSLRIDPAHLNVAQVEIRLSGMPQTFSLAMRVHGEYDARYWRYVDSFDVEQTTADAAAGVTRTDSTLWRVSLPGGRGVIRYRVHIQPPETENRRAWMPYARSDGASINGPDFFLYLPEFVTAPVTLHLDVPAGWQVATAFSGRGTIAELLDAPILAGALRAWSFSDRGTRFHVVYWPLPNGTPFDTSAFVDELRRLAGATLDIFGNAPTPDYYFLIQDGANDALEHRSSVAVGVSSAALARDPRAPLFEIAHEFFHTWNLVAIHPVGYNVLSYRPGRRTPSLWVGEGITLHYADVLQRRAGIMDTSRTRLEHLANLLERYYGSPATLPVSPERASLAFQDSPVVNPDATGGYYLQGQLLAEVLDARLRAATAERRSLDDVFRALYARSRAPRDSGYSSRDVETLNDSICGCDLSVFFQRQVRDTGPIDISPVLARLGLRMQVDTEPSTDENGQPVPDLRLRVDFAADTSRRPQLAVTNPTTVWAKAGLQTGDELIAFNGTQIRAFADLQRVLRGLHVGDHAIVEIRRNGQPRTIDVIVSGFNRPRVHFSDAPNITTEQRAHRRAWLFGGLAQS